MKNTMQIFLGLLFVYCSIHAQMSFEALTVSEEFSKVTNRPPESTSESFMNEGRDWYVSKANGSGQLGTKDRPAKDLGNIIHHLKPNDIIHIAEGIYLSKGSRGADEINVPVQIIAGYNGNFTKRDPWGAHKTIFSGTNEYQKLTDPRLYIRTDQQREKNGQRSQGSAIVVDGIIFDNGPRNRYHKNEGMAIR